MENICLFYFLLQNGTYFSICFKENRLFFFVVSNIFERGSQSQIGSLSQQIKRSEIQVSRFGSNIELFSISKKYTFQFNTHIFRQNTQEKMRKQIIFEQKTQSESLINIRNIFGFVTNYIEDKIKRHEGRWDQKNRKFQVPIAQMPVLAKELQEIDKAFLIEQVPQVVTQFLSKYTQSGSKVKRQILIDNNIVKRYSYIQENILNNVIKNGKNQNFDKVLLVCPQSKILTWCDYLKDYKLRKLTFEQKQTDICNRQDQICYCSYQTLWNKCQMLSKYCFQTIIIDQAEILAKKLNQEHISAISFRKFLSSRHFVFPIITKLWLNKLEWLVPLLSILLPQVKFTWMSKRYRKQNLSQLNFLMKNCNLGRDINGILKQGKNSSNQLFNKILLSMPEYAVEKIRVLNKKYTNVETKKLLENPILAKNKNEKLYMQSMQEILLHEKMQAIAQSILYYSQMNVRLAIIIENCATYRTIQNILCEKQISYCHYEHHQQIIEFNTNPNILVCLVKSQYLLGLDFNQNILTKDQITNSALMNFQPDQYLCLSGVKNVIFPDIQWLHETKKKQQAIRQLFRYLHGDLVRHYFVLKGTYEQKWVKSMEELIGKIQLNIKAKEDLQQLENQQSDIQQGADPTFAFCQINLAKVQEQYGHIKVIKGVTDIDEEFDRLQYEALQQKLKRDSKKKIMEEKAKEKEQQRLQQEKSNNFEDIKKLINETKSAFLNKLSKKKEQQKNKEKQIDSQEEYEMVLKKQQEQSKRKPQQAGKVPIYLPIQDKMIINIDKKLDKQPKSDKIPQPIQKIKDPSIIVLQEDKDRNKTVKSIRLFDKQPDLHKYTVDEQLKQDETQQVQIIQVRKPPPKPKMPKSNTRMFKVILQPNLPFKKPDNHP